MRILAAVLLWAAFFVPAGAVPAACDDYAKIVAHLRTSFGEYLRSTANGKRGARIEVYVSKKYTWSLITVDRYRITACLWLAGTNWRKHETSYER